MSQTASLRIAPPTSLFGRFLNSLDRILLAYAEVMIRNGDVQRYDV